MSELLSEKPSLHTSCGLTGAEGDLRGVQLLLALDGKHPDRVAAARRQAAQDEDSPGHNEVLAAFHLQAVLGDSPRAGEPGEGDAAGAQLG